jgi:hypothetical protein
VEAFQVGNAPPPLPWQPEGAEAVPVHQLVWQGMAPAIVGVDVWLRAELSGDMALEASFDVADGLALGEATLHVLLCGAVLTHADQHDGVERAVELSINRPVQSVTGWLSPRTPRWARHRRAWRKRPRNGCVGGATRR